MALLRRLVDDPACPPDDRDWMLRNIAVCLTRMERIDEAAAFYDEQIMAATDRITRRYFQRSKAELMMGTGRHKPATALCRELLSTAKPGTEEWATDAGAIGKRSRRRGRARSTCALRKQAGFWRKREDIAPCSYLCGRTILWAWMILREKRSTPRGTLLNASSVEPAKQKRIDRMRAEIEEIRAKIAGAEGKSPADATDTLISPAAGKAWHRFSPGFPLDAARRSPASD